MQYCAVKLKTSQNGLVQVTGVKGRAPKIDFLKLLNYRKNIIRILQSDSKLHIYGRSLIFERFEQLLV